MARLHFAKLMLAASALCFTACATAPPAPIPTRQAMADVRRPAEDVALDTQRQGAAVLDLAGIQPGWKVADIMQGAGYFTRLFIAKVGDTVYDGSLKTQLRAIRDELTKLGLAVNIRNNRMVISLPGDVLFDSGRDELKSAGKETLVEVAAVLKTIGERHFQVAGHTDDVKISTNKFPSNWELSTARAVRVTRLLQESGVNPAQLSAAGYGEFDPAVPNDSDENRGKNRRIEISVVPDLSGLVSPSAPSTERI